MQASSLEMWESKGAKIVYIENRKYEMEGMEGYPFSAIIKILIRRKYLADDFGEVYWGLESLSTNQQQVQNESLNMKISEFIEANLGSQKKENFYLKFAHNSNQQPQLSALQLPQQLSQAPPFNESENKNIPIPIKQNSNLKSRSDIVNSPPTSDQFQSNHLQQKDIQKVPLKILLNIIKKLYNHERLAQLQESMETDNVPKQLIESVSKLSKTIYERNVYLYELGHLQKNITKIIGNQHELMKKEQMTEIEEIRTESTQFGKNSPNFLDLEKHKQTEQCLETLLKYINQLKQNHETQNHKLSLVSQLKQDLQKRIIQMQKESILSTPFFNRQANKSPQNYLLRVLQQNKRKVRELNIKINYDKFCNIRYEHFTSLLGSFAQIENFLLILHIDNAKIAVFCPKGISGCEESSYISKIGDNTQVGFISELINEVMYPCQLTETKKMIKIDDRKVSIQKQVLVLLYNFKSRGIELINNPNDSPKMKKEFQSLFAVIPKKSILKGFEIFQVIFDE